MGRDVRIVIDAPWTTPLILVPTSRPTFQSSIPRLRHHYTRSQASHGMEVEDRAVAFRPSTCESVRRCSHLARSEEPWIL